jgi:hypothetical protein
MEARMRGTFPGGPRKSIPAAERTAPARLPRVEQIEERASARRERRGSKKRQKRIVVGVLSAFARNDLAKRSASLSYQDA